MPACALIHAAVEFLLARQINGPVVAVPVEQFHAYKQPESLETDLHRPRAHSLVAFALQLALRPMCSGRVRQQDDQATDCPGPPRQLVFGALQSRLAVDTARLARSTAKDLYLL